jgi:hypothetical protein
MSSRKDVAGASQRPAAASKLARAVQVTHPEVTMRLAISAVVVVWMMVPVTASAQLSADWMVTASANTPGVGGTYWRTDLMIHNPHEFDLPVIIQFLPSGRENYQADYFWLEVYPWETVNLWDVLGPDWFDVRGTGALLVYADTALACDPIEDCHFLATTRTYTVTPEGPYGEYGQTIAAMDVWQAVDWDSYGYAAGILNDGVNFRCNVGVSSWSSDWTVVRVDVQDAVGTILATEEFEVPPFSHVQRRLATDVTGGSLVYYLVDGPDDARVFPYGSIVDQTTGDPSYQAALASVVGVSVAKGSAPDSARPGHPDLGERLASSEFRVEGSGLGSADSRSQPRTLNLEP